MKHLAIWILGLIECLILLMMKFIKVLEGEIYADSAAESGKLIKIPGDISAIRGAGLLTLAGTAVNEGRHSGGGRGNQVRCPQTQTISLVQHQGKV